MSKGRHSRERLSRNLARQRATRPPHPRTLIITEGEKTEVNYFQAIRRHYRLSAASIVVAPSDFGTDPRNVVRFAEHRCRTEKSFDVVYAVFDRDDHQTYHDALQLAESLDKQLKNNQKEPVRFSAVASVPCFELWLLLHFQDVFAPYHRNQVNTLLRNHLPGYEKGMKTAWQDTSWNWETAAARDQQLRQSYSRRSGTDPYTDVDTVVTSLVRAAG